MKKFYALLAGVMLAFAPALAQDYPTNYTADETSGHDSRYPGSIMLKSEEFGDQTIDWASGTGHALYKDATDQVLSVGAGEETQILVNYTGTWMSAYVYIDLNDDKQFGNDVDEENHCYKEGSELVSWSFYSFDPEVSEDPGWNSKGTRLTGGDRSTVNCPGFTAPTEPGTYRCRVKIDWNSIDPAGSVAGHKGGAMKANGGGIIDFMLKVEAPEAPTVLEIAEGKGAWTASNAGNTWHASWQSTATDPYVILASSSGHNNMDYNAGGVRIYTDDGSETYNIIAQDGWAVQGYSFKAFSQNSVDIPCTLPDNSVVTIPASGATVDVAYSTEMPKSMLTFKLEGAKKFIVATEFYVTLVKSKAKSTKQVIFVYDKTAEHNVTYRIPSIASISAGTHAGRIVAFTDYRPGGADVGIGEVDIHAKYSDDFGQTWSEEIKVVDGTWGSSKGTRWYSFGDPVSIADRETGKLLMVSCSGNIRYQTASRDHHQGMEVFWSEDGGATWTEPVDLSEQIYSVLPATPSMFVGSGGFVQSKFIKKGDYYRVYGGILTRNDARNYIIYTDDFGQTWEVLGGADAYSLTGGDEAKAEELPDGSVLQSSRATGGRIFNIWRWDDATYTTGHWESQATSNGSNSGIVAGNNGTNGEILIVPAKRVDDGQSVYLAMQSIPFGSGRANVGIYYKELTAPADYATTATFAANWTKGKQVSFLGSAYSAMVLQEDGNIGFLVEEETYGFGYSQVYHNLSYEDITDGAYTFIAETDPDFDRSAFDVARGSVTVNLLWNGEQQQTVTASGIIGDQLTATGLPDYVVAELPVLTEENNGTTIDVECTWSEDAPVQLSTEESKKHYYLYMRDGQYLSHNPEKDYIDLTVTASQPEAGFMWRFEGNPFTGIRVYTFDGLVLASANPNGDGNTGMNTHPYPVAEDAVPEGQTTGWTLKQSGHYAGGFFLFNVANGYAMNYRNPYLAYWTGGYDQGSTFRAVEVSDDDLRATGIGTAGASEAVSAIYNVSGQRVAVPRQGLYIMRGKKCVVR